MNDASTLAVTAAPLTSGATAPGLPSSPRRRRRWPWVALASLLLLVALAVGLIWAAGNAGHVHVSIDGEPAFASTQTDGLRSPLALLGLAFGLTVALAVVLFVVPVTLLLVLTVVVGLLLLAVGLPLALVVLGLALLLSPLLLLGWILWSLLT